jgi:hypothetical protein
MKKEQSISKQFKEKGKAEFTVPKAKDRKKFAPPTKVEKSKKSYDRKKKFDEACEITKFLESLINKNYSEANKYIKAVVDSKIQKRIKEELNTPLF